MSIRAYRSGTWRPRIVSTRDGSASSWRPEKASTRELRSSMVTGASSSAATALATANRSPDGSPPSDSGSATPTSPSASSERSSAASWAHVAPRRQAEQRDARTRRPRRGPRGSAATGARTTSPTAPRRPSVAQQRGDLGRRVTPTPSTSACGGSTGSSTGSWIDDAADLAGLLRVAVRPARAGWRRGRRAPGRGWPGVAVHRTHSR